jgi:hypothetical protein
MENESAPRIENDESKTGINSRESYGGRLAEYLTGFQLGNPKLVDRLLDDRAIIRGKYNLPERTIRFNQHTEYEKYLRELAHKLGVRIDAKSECGQFFLENEYAGGVYMSDDKRVGANIDRENEHTYTHSLEILEHEIIHALQGANSPRMPIELMEYEAYVAGVSFEHLKKLGDEDRAESLELFFSMMVGGSVRHWYHEQSMRENKETIPVWDDPNYFNS